MIAVAVAACSSETDIPQPDNGETSRALREIQVNIGNSGLSRTTIQYENIDLSHLVWNDGDQIAYITDAEGDVARVATVESNRFTAMIPQNATESNSLIVVWPIGENEGKPLSQMKATINSQLSLNVDEPFDGSMLPMMACVPLPSVSDSSVDADFEILSSIVRLTIDPFQHESEKLQSVAFSSSQPMTGEYKFSAQGATFVGTSTAVNADIIAAEPELQRLYDNKSYIYMVVNRDNYADVALSLTTDTGNYYFPGGSMNVAQEGKTLYRLPFAITNNTVAPEPVWRYRQIDSLSELTAGVDDKYLIVCKSMGKMFGEFNSNNYPAAIDVAISYQGYIDPAAPRVSDMAVTLTENPSKPGDYSIKIPGFRNGYPWIGCMPNYTSGDHGRIYADKENQFDAKLDYWTITFDSEGNVILGAHPNTTDGGPWTMGYSYSGGYFCSREPSTPAMLDIQLFKLQIVE